MTRIAGLIATRTMLSRQRRNYLDIEWSRFQPGKGRGSEGAAASSTQAGCGRATSASSGQNDGKQGQGGCGVFPSQREWTYLGRGAW
jgi:hypothetical protein